MQKTIKNGANGVIENGNTNHSQNSTNLNKTRINHCKHWCFTWNNYNIDEIVPMESRFKQICEKYCFQEETADSGTKHLQGTLTLKKKMRWTEFKLSKEIHWEPTRNLKAAELYCQKENTRSGKQYKFGYPIELKLINELRPWQQSIVDLSLDEPNDRTINWIYDPEGNMGKTVFSKYMFSKHDAIIATGGGVKDIACLIAGLVKNGRDLNKKTTFIFNFPRSTDNVSYPAIESVKDGLMTSTKYESSTLVFNCPHVFIFSNEPPETNKLTKDRWNIFCIKNNELIPFTFERNKLDEM